LYNRLSNYASKNDKNDDSERKDKIVRRQNSETEWAKGEPKLNKGFFEISTADIVVTLVTDGESIASTFLHCGK